MSSVKKEHKQISFVSEEDENSSSSSSTDYQPSTIMGVLSSPSSDYLILSFLGEGTFGKVAKCVKTATNETVAVKMFKNCNLTAEAINEVEMLEKLREFDPDRFNFVRYNNTFIDHERIYIEFEMLHMSLFDFQYKKPEHFLTLKEIRPILHQVATTLVLLKSQGMVHTDLKPDNIMLVDHVNQPLKIKVIDFGLAWYVPEPRLCSYIQPCIYRAPEVILGIPFTSAVDMWSLGCIVAEFFLGSLLFPGSSEYNMLQGIIQTQGQIPQKILQRAANRKFYFRQKKTKRRGFRFWWTLKTPREYGQDTKEGGQFLYSLDDILEIRPPCHLSNEDIRAELKDQLDFVELLKKMLHVDPDKRITPSQLLQDPFITMKYQADMYPTSLYFKSCCEAMEVCRDPDLDSNTEYSTPAWQNHWDHPLILEISSALSRLNIHEDPIYPQSDQLNFLANEKGTLLDLQEPTVNKEKPRKRSYSLCSHRSLSPARKRKRGDADIVKANKETQTETITPTVTITPWRKRTWDAFTAAHPESRSLETRSPVRKKRTEDLLYSSKQAPSEASSEVQVIHQLKRKRDTGEDQFRNGCKDTRSPKRKRRKMNLSFVSQKATSQGETKSMQNRLQLKRPRSEDTNSLERKRRKSSLHHDNQNAGFDVETKTMLNESLLKRPSEDTNSPERKQRKINLNHNSQPTSTTTEPSTSEATQTANRNADYPKRKRRRKESK